MCPRFGCFRFLVESFNIPFVPCLDFTILLSEKNGFDFLLSEYFESCIENLLIVCTELAKSHCFGCCDYNIHIKLSLRSSLIKPVDFTEFNLKHFLSADFSSEATWDFHQSVSHQDTDLDKTPKSTHYDAQRCETDTYCLKRIPS